MSPSLTTTPSPPTNHQQPQTSNKHNNHKQDQLPPCPPFYVHALVSREFRKPFPALFSSFDPSPLASASVAQVHKATMLPSPSPSSKNKGGRDVVVKVQHKGIAALMASDMVAAARVFSVVAWLNSDFLLLLRLLEAWAEEIERELDFRVGMYVGVCVSWEGGGGWMVCC